MTVMGMRTGARSHMFVPGDRRDRFERAVTSGSAVVILDLEDGVAPRRKPKARTAVRKALAGWAGEPAAWVRIDPEALDDDLSALAGREALQGVVVAKADPTSVTTVARWAGRSGPADIAIVPLLETAVAIRNIEELAAIERVTQLMLGEVDLAADLGMHPADDGSEMLPLRLELVTAAAAAGLRPPIGPVWTRLADAAGLSQHAATLRRLGFGGMGLIHPAQVDPVHREFAPTADELARAKHLIETFDHSVRAGHGVIHVPGVGMVDEAAVRTARRLLGEQGERDG